MIRESLAKGRFGERNDGIMAEARSVSSLKKTTTTRRSMSFFSNSKEDVKEISALRQTFEDARNDEVTLKKLAYGMVEKALLGKQLKADVRDVINEFEFGKVLNMVDPSTKKLLKKWVQKGIKHFVENPELTNALTTWGNAHVPEDHVRRTKAFIKERGNLIPLEGVLEQKTKTSLTKNIQNWNSNRTTRGLKCKLFKFSPGAVFPPQVG